MRQKGPGPTPAPGPGSNCYLLLNPMTWLIPCVLLCPPTAPGLAAERPCQVPRGGRPRYRITHLPEHPFKSPVRSLAKRTLRD